MLNNTPIPLSNNVNYLVVQLDSKLNFFNHLNMVEHKLSRGIGVLYKLKEVLLRDALLKLHYALIHPYLLYGLYGLILWGSTFPIHINSLAKFYNKAIEIVGGGKKYENSLSLCFQLKIPKLQELFKLEIAKFVYNFLHDNLPSTFSGIFSKTCAVSKRKNRSSINPNNLYIPHFI